MMIFSLVLFFFKQKTAYEMRISDWSSDVCSSDLREAHAVVERAAVTVIAAVGNRRDEFMQQVAMRSMQFDQVDAGAVGPLCRLDEQIGRAAWRERVCPAV